MMLFIARLKSLLSLPFCLLVTFFAAIYCKVKNAKLVVIRADRIGHFIPDSAEAIIRQNNFSSEIKKIYIFSCKPVNKFWGVMVKRTLPIWNHFPFNKLVFRIFPSLNNVFENATKLNSRDQYGWYNQYDSAKLEFNEREHNIGISFLQKNNIDPNKFICLLVRDNSYLSSIHDFQHIDFSYHDYRNSDLKSYESGIMALIEKGYWVIRIGRNSTNHLKLEHPKFIDINYNKTGNDLLDIWLVANANALISTGTGHDVLASIYQKPILFLNFLPLLAVHSFHPTITVPKKLFWEKTGHMLSFEEYLNASYFESNHYKDHGINIIDLSEIEIKEAVEEFIQFIENKTENIKDRHQDDLWNIYRNHPNRMKYSKYIHPFAKFGNAWSKSVNLN